jgi:hypothetical protein
MSELRLMSELWMECSICMEPYTLRDNIATKLNPCNHHICYVCCNRIMETTSKCPECRGPIRSHTRHSEICSVLERSGIHSNSNNINAPDGMYLSQNEKRGGEIIRDKCKHAIYVIDNSTSMIWYSDGKIFSSGDNGEICKHTGVNRWDEAVDKTTQIAVYNIKRGICAVYYLLNSTSLTRVINRDYVVIDPNQSYDMVQLQLTCLKNNILKSSNVRGSTPLHEITNYLQTSLQHFTKTDEYKHYPISYSIITDGSPNNRQLFENSLRDLAKKYSIYLTINLCTDEEDTIQYYNKLDVTLGGEMSGLDVIDDFEAEYIEVFNAGNTIVTYSEDVHIARMAGCYSIISDMLDEEALPLHYIIKLCNEVLQIENPPSFYNQGAYIQSIKDYNYEVYDITKHKFVPIINVPKLNFKITCYKTYESCNVKWSMYKYSILTAILSILIWSAIYVIF